MFSQLGGLWARWTTPRLFLAPGLKCSPKRRTSKERLYIVLDNLDTHTNEAATKWLEAHRLVSFHYTPTHASWVNIVECFFSILTRQGLQQAVPSVRQRTRIFSKRFIEASPTRRQTEHTDVLAYPTGSCSEIDVRKRFQKQKRIITSDARSSD